MSVFFCQEIYLAFYVIFIVYLSFLACCDDGAWMNCLTSSSSCQCRDDIVLVSFVVVSRFMLITNCYFSRCYLLF